jgi:hypothetical protein
MPATVSNKPLSVETLAATVATVEQAIRTVSTSTMAQNRSFSDPHRVATAEVDLLGIDAAFDVCRRHTKHGTTTRMQAGL